jgi:hypothetical protein
MALWGMADGGGKGGWKLLHTGVAEGWELLKADAPHAPAFFLYSSNFPML